MSVQTNPSEPSAEQTRRLRLIDWAAASPLIVWLLFGAFGLGRQIAHELAGTPASLRLVLEIASEVTTICFLALEIALLLVRLPPAAKEPGIWPRAVAAAGLNGGLLFLALRRVPLDTLAIAATSYLLVTVGMLLSVLALITLGRSFSIFPQARRLTTTGLYSVVRHPLYIAEFVSSLGAMWQFSQPWSAMIVFGVLAVQIPRMHYEEDVLRKSFPEYAAYAARVRWRLVPFLY